MEAAERQIQLIAQDIKYIKCCHNHPRPPINKTMHLKVPQMIMFVDFGTFFDYPSKNHQIMTQEQKNQLCQYSFIQQWLNLPFQNFYDVCFYKSINYRLNLAIIKKQSFLRRLYVKSMQSNTWPPMQTSSLSFCLLRWRCYFCSKFSAGDSDKNRRRSFESFFQFLLLVPNASLLPLRYLIDLYEERLL